MTEYWYAFQFKIGCKTINLYYRGPGDNWDPNKKISPFDFMPMSFMVSRTEEEKRQDQLEARARLGPEFILEQTVEYRDDEGTNRTKVVSTTADRATIEDMRDALNKLLDYDDDIRAEWGQESDA